jgi:1,4-alpha-glucan branching enzyme
MAAVPQTLGAFTFVLHSHLPYARRAGRWPHGEEWIHEAASETYLPLLEALLGLREGGVQFRLTIGLTPILCEQLADETIQRNLAQFMQDRLQRAADDVERWSKLGDARRVATAGWYRNRYAQMLALFERWHGNILDGFKSLQDSGHVEIATSAATHGYLPLMERDSTIYAQLNVGVHSYRRHFGRAPRSCWLPECAYRPAYLRQADGQTYTKPGLETFLAENGLRLFFAETHTVEGGAPIGKAVGDAVGPYGEIKRRYVMPQAGYQPPTHRTTFLPYWVGGTEVAVMGRNSRTGLQVWSAAHGYPGDFGYREFHKRDGISGLHYWQVTGPNVDLGDKMYWHPEAAFQKAEEHAEHFVGVVESELQRFQAESGRQGIVLAAYDTELFGHWWFEGITWLAGVLERLARDESVGLCTASEYLETHPPEDVIALPESSWGQGGNHFTWMNADTEWMVIHRAEYRMERLVEHYPEAEGSLRHVLNQCARELLLLESSDWPFLITTGQAREYAIERFQNHVERFEGLAGACESGNIGPAEEAQAAELWELDRVFPQIDYRVFKRREPALD